MTPSARNRGATFDMAAWRCAASRCIQTAFSMIRSNVSPRVVIALKSGRLSSIHSMREER
jgi:hypothetical protein